MIIEGFIMLQYNGCLAMYGKKTYHELREGDQVEVDTGITMIEMSVQQALDGYYLHSQTFSFYPKMVYAKFDTKKAGRS